MIFHDKGLMSEDSGEPSSRPFNVGTGTLPAAMSMEHAQAYSGFRRNHFNYLIVTAKLDRRRVGNHGGYIVRRDQLDAAIAETFSGSANSLETDFDFA